MADTGPPFSYFAQCPVDRFFNKVPIVCGIPANQIQIGKKCFVGHLFMMNCHLADENKSGTPHELFVAAAPAAGTFRCPAAVCKEVFADLIADISGVEIHNP